MRAMNLLVSIALFVGLSFKASAFPIMVDATYSGTPGAWLVSFNLHNNFAPFTLQVYEFGVNLPGLNQTSIVGTPQDIEARSDVVWLGPSGGGDINVYQNWDGNIALPGSSESGFQVLDTALDEPTNFFFYVFTSNVVNNGYAYTGGDDFYHGCNGSCPGFESFNVPTSAAPEPRSVFLVCLPLIVLWWNVRRQRRRFPSHM